VKYSFHVDAAHSHWMVRVGAQAIRAASTGTIWFDRETQRVLRVEIKSVDIPAGFPLETAELAVEYDYVGLDGEKYLVPTRAEQLGCRRGVAFCNKNSIDFRDYRAGSAR
jgi:hypothetical protein